MSFILSVFESESSLYEVGMMLLFCLLFRWFFFGPWVHNLGNFYRSTKRTTTIKKNKLLKDTIQKTALQPLNFNFNVKCDVAIVFVVLFSSIDGTLVPHPCAYRNLPKWSRY